jgi:hypothetical protein
MKQDKTIEQKAEQNLEAKAINNADCLHGKQNNSKTF